MYFSLFFLKSKFLYYNYLVNFNSSESNSESSERESINLQQPQSVKLLLLHKNNLNFIIIMRNIYLRTL